MGRIAALVMLGMLAAGCIAPHVPSAHQAATIFVYDLMAKSARAEANQTIFWTAAREAIDAKDYETAIWANREILNQSRAFGRDLNATIAPAEATNYLGVLKAYWAAHEGRTILLMRCDEALANHPKADSGACPALETYSTVRADTELHLEEKRWLP